MTPSTLHPQSVTGHWARVLVCAIVVAVTSAPLSAQAPGETIEESRRGVTAEARCEAKDLDHDNDVDQAHFSLFQRCLSGTGTPIDPGCAL